MNTTQLHELPKMCVLRLYQVMKISSI